MKRINYLIAASFAAVALATSCSKEVSSASSADSGVPAGQSLSITACLDTTNTKTYYKGGTDICWTAADRLQVFNSENNGSTFKNATGAGASADFTCDAWVGGTPVLAVHFDESEITNSVCSGTDSKIITSYLKPTQTIVHKQSYARNAGLSIGKVSESSGVYTISDMKNVFALIGFKVESNDIKKITLTGNNNEDLAGWVDVDYNGGAPTWKASAVSGKETSKSIVVSVSGNAGSEADKSLFNPGTLYYISVLPQTLSNGFTLEIEKNDGSKAERVVSSSIELKRNQKRLIKTAIDNGLEFTLTIDCTTVDGKTFKYDNGGTGSYLPQRSTRIAAGTDFWAASYPSYKFNGAVCFWSANDGGLNMAANTYVRFPLISGYKLTKISEVKVVHSSERKYKITSATAATYAAGTAVTGGEEKSLKVDSAAATFTLTDEYDANKNYYIVCNSEGGFRFKLTYTSQE